MDAAGVGQAVLVQPSFLGVDNSFLLDAIAAPAAASGASRSWSRTSALRRWLS